MSNVEQVAAVPAPEPTGEDPERRVVARPVRRRRSLGGILLIAMPYAWLLFFFLLPFFIVFKISFSEIVG